VDRLLVGIVTQIRKQQLAENERQQKSNNGGNKTSPKHSSANHLKTPLQASLSAGGLPQAGRQLISRLSFKRKHRKASKPDDELFLA